MHKGDASSADGKFDRLMDTPVADVQRVARRYCTPENRTVLTVLPAQARH
jgi:predicted Zn-dependent peptidase